MGRKKTVWRRPRIGAVRTGQGALTPSGARASGLPPAPTASFSPVCFLIEAFIFGQLFAFQESARSGAGFLHLATDAWGQMRLCRGAHPGSGGCSAAPLASAHWTSVTPPTSNNCTCAPSWGQDDPWLRTTQSRTVLAGQT